MNYDMLKISVLYEIRFLFDINYDDHVTPCYKQAYILKLKELGTYHMISILQTEFYNIPNHKSWSLVPPHRTNSHSKYFTVNTYRLRNNLIINFRL